MMLRAPLACAPALVIGCGIGQRGDDNGNDTTPPQLIAIAPASWLHEPIRITLDEPVTTAGAFVRATLAGDPVAATLAADGCAVVVTIDPAARGVGTLALDVGGVCDLAGNAMASLHAHFELAAWGQTPLPASPALRAPALAIAGDGTTYAAWASDGRVAVARDGEPLGDALDGAAPALALDAGEQPVVAWIAGGTPHVARWEGDHWHELAAPPGGAPARAIEPRRPSLAIALAPGVTAATVSDDVVTIARLDSGGWQLLGDPLPLGGALAGELLLADGAVAWIANAALHVYRYDGAWTPLPAIAGAEHASLARRGDAIAVAWDQRAGSYAVLAAELAGTAWRRLGRALDVDVAGDAREPAIAIDATGAPVVAWHEHIETRERGVLARWDGTAWTIVGGATWLADAGAAAAAPSLALHAGGAPVVGYPGGVARFNGPRVAGPGLVQRAPLAGCAFSSAAPPQQLLATGCFTLAAPGVTVPHAGLVPYDIVVELWSDGSKKRRWLALPDGAALTPSPTGAWAAPVGAFVVKEFDLEVAPGDSASRRAIETRVLVHAPGGWQGFTYQWRRDGSDAELLTDGEWTYDWPLATGATHRHLYPSRSECLSCHEGSYGPLLGLRPPQLARWFDYDGTIADQLVTLAELGVVPPTTPGTMTPLPSPHDPSESWEQRARGYMAANCAHCHNPLHIAIKDLRYTTPLADTGLCAAIAPGDPARSLVYQRVTSRPGMPALATLAVDPLAADVFGSWIAGMSACP